MSIKKWHYGAGIFISVFIVLHLCNHVVSVFGAAAHLTFMDNLRVVYRNVVIESLLLLAVLLQVISGLRLFWQKRKTATSFYEKLQRWSGFYLAMFFVIHLSAVLGGRYWLGLDTNFYFGVAGLNNYPFCLFFVPYYGLAIFSFFAHIASIHHQKMQKELLGVTVTQQSNIILVLGVVGTGIILYGLTNGLEGVTIPQEYEVLIGK